MKTLAVLDPRAAFVDVGSEQMHVSVAGDEPAVFGCVTSQLYALRDWLKAQGVRSVAMEATGVYWLALYSVLEAAGFEVRMVNGRQTRNLPGRKSDMQDCQWGSTLHAHGLLRAGFVPPAHIRRLQDYLRLRGEHVAAAAGHVQHMQKALERMNIKLHDVISSLTGASGLAVVRAILAGERDPEALACLRHYSCHSSVETIAKALTGSYRAEHLFALDQALALYDAYHEKASACDVRIEAVLKELIIHRGHDHGSAPPVSRRRNRTDQANALAFDVRASLFGLLGKDVTTIDGLGPYLSLKLIAECGDDLTSWPSAKHFTSWLGLAPSNKISGGKMLSSRTRRSGGRAAALLRLAAVTVGRTDTALGAFYRRLSARIGKAKAVTATARKIAVLFYNAVRYGMDYVDPGASSYEARYRTRVVDNLHRRAKAFGFVLQPLEPKVGAAVS